MNDTEPITVEVLLAALEGLYHVTVNRNTEAARNALAVIERARGMNERRTYREDLAAAVENISDGGGTIEEHARLLVRDHGVSIEEARGDVSADLVRRGGHRAVITIAYEPDLEPVLDPASKGINWIRHTGTLSDDELGRVIRSAAWLIENEAGTPTECLDTAVIWERG